MNRLSGILACAVLIWGIAGTGVSMALNVGGLEVMVGGKVLKNGGEWFTPLNAPNNKVALFSEQREGFSIYNKSISPMTINKIELVPDKEAASEEFALQTADMKPQPLNFQETTIEAGKRVDFYVRYYPVQSKHLGAAVNITYNGAETYSFRISGKGRDKAFFHEKSQTLTQKLFGGPLTDEMVSGMVMDTKGRVPCYQSTVPKPTVWISKMVRCM